MVEKYYKQFNNDIVSSYLKLSFTPVNSETIKYVQVTEEEYKEATKTKPIDDTPQKIEELKAELSSTDYQVIKCNEYSLLNLDCPYDIEKLHAERQALRDKINELERDTNV